MNKLLQKVAKLFLGLSLAAGVGVAIGSGRKDAGPVNAALNNTPVWSSGTPAFGSSYASGTKTLNSISWFVSCAGNNTCLGWNTTTQGGNNDASSAPLSTISQTTKYGTYQSSGGWDVGKIVITISNSDSVTGTWYIWYSTNSGSSWTQATTGSLTSSTTSLTYDHGSNLGSGTRFAFGFGTTKTTKTRISISNIQVYEYSASYNVTFAVNTAGYGTVSSSSINNVPSGSSITVNGNQVTINNTTITATPSANTAQYTYAFSNWSNTSGTITAARTITANFTRTTNTFTVDDSGITGGSLDSTAAIEYGGDLDVNIVPDTNYSVPTSVSVTMGGTDISGDVQYENGYLYYTPVTGNIVVTAACIPQGTAYTVTYNANSGTVSPASEEVIENGHPSFPTPTRSGYNFKGWQVNGSGTAYTDPEDYTVTGDVTFVASWVAVYTVTFNANGGSSTPSAQSVESGSTFTFPSPGTKTHYTCDGWSSTGDEPYYAIGATSPAVTGNITYTAHWVEDAKYTVTYSAASPGSGSYAHTNNYGGTYTLLAFASLSGITYDSTTYRFKDYTVDGVSRAPGYQFTLSSAKTVTVNFEEIPPEDNITYSKTAGIRGTTTSAWGTAGSVTDSTGATYFLNSMGVSSTSSAVRWNANGYLYTTSVPATLKLASISIASITSGKTINVYASNSAYSEAPSDSALGSLSENSLSYTFESSYKYIALKGTASSTEVGTITITYEKLPELSSVTTSGQKTTFSAGEQFSYGGTLTAHYTKGKADETNKTPAYFKIGASDIDPTSAGTSITTSTTMTIASHNGKYIYVVYTEDGITKSVEKRIKVTKGILVNNLLNSILKFST